VSAINRVIINTGVTYAKALIRALITLYSTRVVLNALGACDYGMYNVIGGIIALLPFFNAAMTFSTQRYISFNLGRGNVTYIDAYLSSMSFMLALETLGLSSCAVNWPDVEHKEREMHSLLGLKDYQRPMMCMAVLYPDTEGMVAFSEKRQLDSIRRYD